MVHSEKSFCPKIRSVAMSGARGMKGDGSGIIGEISVTRNVFDAWEKCGRSMVQSTRSQPYCLTRLAGQTVKSPHAAERGSTNRLLKYRDTLPRRFIPGSSGIGAVFAKTSAVLFVKPMRIDTVLYLAFTRERC